MRRYGEKMETKYFEKLGTFYLGLFSMDLKDFDAPKISKTNVEGLGELSYFLWDTTHFGEHDLDFVNLFILKYATNPNYKIDFNRTHLFVDNDKLSENVKKIMSENKCDLSITVMDKGIAMGDRDKADRKNIKVSHINSFLPLRTVIINNFDKDENIYSSFALELIGSVIDSEKRKSEK